MRSPVPAPRDRLLERGHHKAEEQKTMNDPSEQANNQSAPGTGVIEGLPDRDHEAKEHPDCRAEKDEPADDGDEPENAQDPRGRRESRRPQYLAEVRTRLVARQQLGSNHKGQKDPDDPTDDCDCEESDSAAYVSDPCAKGCCKAGENHNSNGLEIRVPIGLHLLVALTAEPCASKESSG